MVYRGGKTSYNNICSFESTFHFYSGVVRQLADGRLYNLSMYVYALFNLKVNKIYIGQTADIEKRLISHNRKIGNHYTAKFHGEWKLIYKESVATRSEALKREKQLKSFRGREFLKQFIQQD